MKYSLLLMEQVILVDPRDREIGSEEKLQAHKSGKLHRAVSVFLFNQEKQFLIQKRALSKYHSGGLWSNSCCGHPRPGELAKAAAERRLFEEMGIRVALSKMFEFTYRAKLDQGLVEHEYDHVFYGEFNGSMAPNPEEVCDVKWIDLSDLENEILKKPDQFTVWFKLLLPKVTGAACLRS